MNVSWQLNPLLPVWATITILVAAIALATWDYFNRSRKTAFPAMSGYLVLRITALSILGVMALGPVRVIEYRESDLGGGSAHSAPVVVLRDVSTSLPAGRLDMLDTVSRELLDAAGNPDHVVLDFARTCSVSSGNNSPGPDPSGTDISAAFLAASLLQPVSIILLSDGAWNLGADPVPLASDLDLPPVICLSPAGDPGYSFGFAPHGASGLAENSPGVHVPDSIAAGQPFNATVRYFSHVAARLFIRLRGPVSGPDSPLPVAFEDSASIGPSADLQNHSFRLSASVPGTWIVEAEVVPAARISGDVVLSAQAVTHCRSGPLRILIYQSVIGWENAALGAVFQGKSDISVSRFKSFNSQDSAPPEPEEIDTIILTGFPEKRLAGRWKAALAACLKSGKGFLVIASAPEYSSWAESDVLLPGIFRAVPSDATPASATTVALSPEAAVLTESRPFSTTVFCRTDATLVGKALPALVTGTGGSPLAAILNSGESRVAWISEPPFTSVFGRVAETSSMPDEFLLDLVYFLAHRKRVSGSMRLETVTTAASVHDTIMLRLSGCAASRVPADLVFSVRGPESSMSYRLDPAVLQSPSGQKEIFFPWEAGSPGLHLMSVTAGYADGRRETAGTACMVQGVDRELSLSNLRRNVSSKLAAATGGSWAVVSPGDTFVPSEEALAVLRSALPIKHSPAGIDEFELYRWWPLWLIVLLALFIEWTLRTR